MSDLGIYFSGMNQLRKNEYLPLHLPKTHNAFDNVSMQALARVDLRD